MEIAGSSDGVGSTFQVRAYCFNLRWRSPVPPTNNPGYVYLILRGVSISDGDRRFLRLDHHYAVNSHHPQVSISDGDRRFLRRLCQPVTRIAIRFQSPMEIAGSSDFLPIGAKFQIDLFQSPMEIAGSSDHRMIARR